MELYCDYCGRYIIKSPREIKRNNHHFCSKECYYNYRRNIQRKQKRPRNMNAQNKIKALARRLASIKVEND